MGILGKSLIGLVCLLAYGASNAVAIANSDVIVRMQTSKGTIVLELYPDKAPITVANFLKYVNGGFYDGTIYHRVIAGFMIQGGGFEPGMLMKNTRPPITIESDNGLKNDLGTIAMARTMDPNSATSQFFINAKDNDFLNYTSPSRSGWGYAVFGRVVQGMDVVRKIETVATTSINSRRDVPVEDIIIEKASVSASTNPPVRDIGPGDGKETLKIKGCGKVKNTALLYGIQLTPDGKLSLDVPAGTYKGKYEVTTPDEKLSLLLNKKSRARLYNYIEAAATSLCRVDSKIKSPKVKKVSVKYNNGIARMVLVVKFTARAGARKSKGVFKVVIDAEY